MAIVTSIGGSTKSGCSEHLANHNAHAQDAKHILLMTQIPQGTMGAQWSIAEA
jgi:hypothetical protein